MTYDELRRRASAVLFEAWLSEVGLTEATLRGFLEHGVPAEWAAEFERTFRIPVSDWPRVIPSPHRTKALHKRLRSSTVNDVSMHADQRKAIATAHGVDDQAFVKALQKAGYVSKTALAKALGISPAVLSLNRNKLRPIPKARAEAIAKLTGWPADARHWPCGIVTDGE